MMQLKCRLLKTLLLLLLLGSCSKRDELNRHQQTLRINFLDGDLPSTHPHVGIDYRMRALQSALFEGLTRINPEGQPQPAAAETILISDDKTRYTFKIRPIIWSNGESVTACHFADAWRRAIAKGSGCVRPDLFYIIKNAEKVKKGQLPLSDVGIHVLDNKTLEIELEHPAPYFLELITNPIFSPLYDNAEEPFVFNGPFVIDTWSKDQTIALKKNPLYWDSRQVSLDRIEIIVVTDAMTAFNLFDKGELDWIGSPFSRIPAEMIPACAKTGMLKYKEVARIYWLYCNTQISPFNNPSIRKALSYAIDRKEIVDHVLLGQTAAITPLPTAFSLIQENFLPSQRNIELARQFFEQGLTELGLNRETFPNIILSHSHISGQRRLSEVIQSNWQTALGITVTLEGSEWNHYFSNLSRGNFEVGGCLKSAMFNDPIYHLELLQDQSHSYNVSRWEDPLYKSLLEQARETADQAARLALLRSAEHILLEQMPVIPIFSETYQYMIRPHIQNVIINDLGQVDFKWIKTNLP